MAAGNSGSGIEAFPDLVINQSGSWKKFADKLLFALELWEHESDFRFIANPTIKTTASLNAVRLNGRNFLWSLIKSVVLVTKH